MYNDMCKNSSHTFMPSMIPIKMTGLIIDVNKLNDLLNTSGTNKLPSVRNERLIELIK